ncbi:TetR/AcrR family transcriptional regulator [Bacillus tropicus]|uniref:TetR/AcrR family transcriptional regulator n=1 Tax=Bacillus TaxID=1386 RepID=UPI0002D679FE|nr:MULTISPECIES: TetR/AcrR family transcriptional regulator [Bacillus]ALL24627.1 TetR family transcriptional regulator [Bacillus thuringiensis]OOL09358.1 TetR family transcriptional regulator [Bacillus cereus]MCB4845195.1 TetR/AcrR family transcriptional regulator [Bacillus tropicus]MCC1488747.1 TetR/AcrR family transcriptional regulator [Bacillus tropicus]MCU5208959.1 TetR/AcrR family transcriptional regulator [Bacillus paranthracis]
MQSKRGRPRNIETQKAILSASYELLLESGFKAVTVDKIAERAKVSKATIYKWWPNKAAVVMDGFLSAAARLPVPDTGSALNDILIHATSLANFLISREGTIINELVGEGQFDSKLAEEYRVRYFQPRRLQAKQLLEKGIKRGELKENLDIELSIDLIYGPIFYRLLVTGEKLDDSYVHDLVINAFEGIRLR